MNKFYLEKKVADDGTTILKYTLNKEQLLSSEFENIINESDERLNVVCEDFGLSFYGKDYKKLLNIHEKLTTKNNGELSFVEKTAAGVATSIFYDYHRSYTKISSFPFEDVIKANFNLQQFADEVNKGYKNEAGEYVQYSPYEKFVICSKFINKFSYTIGLKNALPSQSFITTAKKLTGCCLGKAESLTNLLKMVGIDSSTMAVHPVFGDYRYYEKKLKDKKISKINPKYLLCKLAYKITLKKMSLYASNHAINVAYVDDDKYNIHGCVGCDISNQFLFTIFNNSYLLDFLSHTSYSVDSYELNAFIQRHSKLISETLKDEKNKQRINEIANKHFTEMKNNLKTILSPAYDKIQSPGVSKLIEYLQNIDDFKDFKDFYLYTFEELHENDKRFKITSSDSNAIANIIHEFQSHIRSTATWEFAFESILGPNNPNKKEYAKKILSEHPELSFKNFKMKLAGENELSK